MLDPFTALSVASAVVQFVDFGSSIITEAQRMHKSTNDTQNELSQFDESVSRLRALGDKLERDTAKSSPDDAPDQKAASQLAKACKSFADRFEAAFKEFKMQEKPSKSKSVVLAYKLTRKKGMFNSFQKELDTLRSDVMARLLEAIDNRSSAAAHTLDLLSQQSLRIDANTADSINILRDELKQALEGHAQTGRTIEALVTTLNTIVQEGRKVSEANQILRGLRFDSMYYRRERITDHYEDTYQWIFESRTNNKESKALRANYMNWLRAGEGIYWISGKAGSGKSTLMKFLYDHNTTWITLSEWAGQRRLIPSSHFFWNAGSDLHKSQVGLLRVICFEIFRTCPDLIQTVCAEKIATIRESMPKGKNEMLELDQPLPWTLKELKVIMSWLGSEQLSSEGQKICFAFFIDGLDEYDGDHRDIINVLQGMVVSGNIKICASSRPWNVFENAFGAEHQPKLALQDLTRSDIRKYVVGNLYSHQQFCAMEVQGTFCNDIVIEIIDKANGVFLWVYLVVQALLKSLDNGDNSDDLWRRLAVMPQGLEEYFRHMFDTLDEFYQEQTAKIFLICIRANHPLSLIGFAALEEQNHVARLICENPGQITDDLGQYLKSLSKRINARCRDLVEVVVYNGAPTRSSVDFLHRTVRDFLRNEDMVRLIESRIESGFSALQKLCQMKLICLDWGSDAIDMRRLLRYASEMEREQQATPTNEIDQLEKVIGRRLYTLGASVPVYSKSLMRGDLPSATAVLTYLLIEEHVSLYTSQRAETNPKFLECERDPTYLSVALTSEFPEMVEIMLRYGADPNLRRGEGGTDWSKYLWSLSLKDGGVENRRNLLLISENMIMGGAKYLASVECKNNNYCEEREVLCKAFGTQEAERLIRLHQPETSGIASGKSAIQPSRWSLKTIWKTWS